MRVVSWEETGLGVWQPWTDSTTYPLSELQRINSWAGASPASSGRWEVGGGALWIRSNPCSAQHHGHCQAVAELRLLLLVLLLSENTTLVTNRTISISPF